MWKPLRLIAMAEEKRHEKLEGAKAAFLAETAEKAKALGLKMEDLFPSTTTATTLPRKKRSDAGTQAPAKYRSPEGKEWSGRGRPPQWLNDAQAQGKSLDDFRV